MIAYRPILALPVMLLLLGAAGCGAGGRTTTSTNAGTATATAPAGAITTGAVTPASIEKCLSQAGQPVVTGNVPALEGVKAIGIDGGGSLMPGKLTVAIFVYGSEQKAKSGQSAIGSAAAATSQQGNVLVVYANAPSDSLRHAIEGCVAVAVGESTAGTGVMPDLIGVSEGKVPELLKKAVGIFYALRITYQKSKKPVNTVIRQSPEPGTPVAPHKLKAKLVVSQPPPIVVHYYEGKPCIPGQYLPYPYVCK